MSKGTKKIEAVLNEAGFETVRLDRSKVTKDPIWYCKVGSKNVNAVMPGGCDSPMRDAIEEEFKRITGDYPQFCFSGWGQELTAGEQAAIDNKNLSDKEFLQEIVDKVVSYGLRAQAISMLETAPDKGAE